MRRRGPWLVVLPFAVLSAASCDDDGAGGGDPWEEISIADAPPAGALFDLAFSSTRGLAAGAVSPAPPATTYTPLVLTRDSGDTWRVLVTATLPALGFASAAGFAPDGGALVGGASPVLGAGFLLDERGGWSRIPTAIGPLGFATGGGAVRVAGTGARPNLALVSTAADTWTPESLPFQVEEGDCSIQDIAARDGVFWACGYDDGGDGSTEHPSEVLFRNDGGGWVWVDVPCGGCPFYEFRSVAVSATGGVLLGGAWTDPIIVPPIGSAAFLHLRTPSGDWVELTLPEPWELERVNDILIAEDGTILLACGTSTFMPVVSVPGQPIRREATIPGTRIFRLAEDAGGAVWAAGYAAVDLEPGLTRPVLWRRAG